MRRRAPIAALVCLLLAGCQLVGGGTTDRAAVTGGPVLGDQVTVTTLDAPASAAPVSSAPVSSAPVSSAPVMASAPAAPSQTAALPAPSRNSPPPAPPPAPPSDTAPAEPPPVPKPAAQLACEAKGGQWGKAGATSAMTCFKRTRDAGKSCRRESDCSTLCLARSRTCAPVTPLFGCHPVLQNDGREVTLCTD